MNVVVIGTCSLCGGPVSAPSQWYGIFPPTPQCAQCGATAASNGPVIPMTPNKTKTITIGTGTTTSKLDVFKFDYDPTE